MMQGTIQKSDTLMVAGPAQVRDKRLLQQQVVGMLNTLQRMGLGLRGESSGSGALFMFFHSDGEIKVEGAIRAGGWVIPLKKTAGTAKVIKKMLAERGGE